LTSRSLSPAVRRAGAGVDVDAAAVFVSEVAAAEST
jgi:hypothetical protein